MAIIGDLSEFPSEVTFEWKIADFFSLSVENKYESPKFYFSGASWNIEMFPNGETKNDLNRISLYLQRTSSGVPITVDYKFGVKKLDGKLELIDYCNTVFENAFVKAGFPKLIHRKILMEKKSLLVPDNVLTIVCILKGSKPHSTSYSVFNQLQDLSDNLLDILNTSVRSDLKLKLIDRTLPVHQVILETRSPYFKAMLKHDLSDEQIEEISIDDVDPDIMINIIMYLYFGQMDFVTTENAIAHYAAANKFDIKYIKEVCCEFILRNLSVDWVCDVIKFADTYKEKEIRQRAVEYFKENAVQILDSEQWRTFSNENPDLRSELLATLVKSMLPNTETVNQGENSTKGENSNRGENTNITENSNIKGNNNTRAHNT